MKTLAIVAMSVNTVQACAEQLHHLFCSCVNISSYSIRKGQLPLHIHADLVLFASQEAYTQGRLHCKGAEILLARRSINYHEVHKLFEIPAGTDVLLVNDLISSTSTTIALLQTLGVDHINYHPCCPQMRNYPHLKIAVTPGEKELVPDFVETVVDIKTRLVDITTIVEILLRLGMLSLYADFLSANYVRDIIRLSKNSQRDTNEIQRLEEIVRQKHMKEQNITLYTFDDIIGQSKAIGKTISMAKKMASSDSAILIQGESGTGKEIIAQGIHNASPRHNGPFVAVNLAALSESLLESALFGYTSGAFTGASRHGAIGLFEEAHHGTIFLDEIGDVPLAFQVKLLRVLQERQIRRVGSAKVIPIDVRIIAATNQNLPKLIVAGSFRQDLYYRLNVLPIRLPPLCERGDDILLLAKHFYQRQARLNKNLGLTADSYFQQIADCLLRYAWPGNIRELQNVVEYLTILFPEQVPSPECLPQEMQQSTEVEVPPSEIMDYEKIKQQICQAVAEANRQHSSIGRRSLADKLQQPENRIRQLLNELHAEGRLISRRGRSGLQFKS